MARRRTGLPTAARLTEALGGGPFVVVGPNPIEGPRVIGWSGFPLDPHGIRFTFRVGRHQQTVEVESSLGPESREFGDAHLAMVLLAHLRRMRFPILVERVSLPIKVNGRRRAFRGCAVDRAVIGEARLGDLVVRVTCAEGAPKDGFVLARLEGEALTQLLRSEAERWKAIG